MRHPGILAFAALVAFSGVHSATAQERPYRTKIFAAAAYVAPLGESDHDFGGVVDSVKVADKLGWEFGLAGRWNRLIGFELSYLNATQDVEFDGTTVGEIDLEPISATLEFHLVPTRFVDLWVGPTASWVRWSDLHLAAGGRIEGSADFAWGATVGLDIGLAEHLALTGAVRYLDANADLEGFDSLAVDPLFARVGLAVRY